MSTCTYPLNGQGRTVIMAGRRSPSPDGLDDAALVREVMRSGDDDYFEVLVRRHRDSVFKLLVSILGPGAEAESEDLAQDVFVLAYRKLETFRQDGTFSAWLFRIARNAAYGHFRNARRNFRHVSDDKLQTMHCPQPLSDPESEVLAGERHTLLLRHVQRLPDPQRTVIHLFYWYGCSHAEIADLLEMNIQTVKSHLYRTRHRLAKTLAATGVQ